MQNLIKTAAVGLAMCLAGAPAVAQVVSDRWTSGSRTYKINVNAPGRGDAITQSAASQWTNAGARFAFVNGGIERQRQAEMTASANQAVSTIEDGAPYFTPQGQEATAVAVTRALNGVMSDSDIFVNRNLILADAFHFGSANPPANQFDYHSIILHELGHVVGFRDQYSATGCVTYGWLDRGQVQRTFCPAELTALRSAYGAR